MFRQALWNGVLLSALSVSLHAQRPVLTIDDLLTTGGREVAGVLSPDGKYFAVAQRGQVAIALVHGGEAKPLTNTPEAKSELSWSRDSQQIAYISQGDVWTISVSGGEPLRLTHDPAGPGDPRGATDHHPLWNPNGRWILYQSGREGFDELYVVSDDGKEEK